MNYEAQQAAIIYHSDFGAIMPRCTGFTSAISSFTIIYVILRSTNRLSTIYHRIMFGMAVSDMMSSIAIGLTSLPMPRTLPSPSIWGDAGFSFSGTRLGNFHTCEAQGFFYLFGFITGLTYYTVLCVYYACAIALRMHESKIQKYLEPFFHLVPLILGLTSALPPLFHQLYNVSFFEFWCNFTPYPIGRKVGVRGERVETLYTFTVAGSICAALMVIVLSLTAVVCRLRHAEKQIKQCFKEEQEINAEEGQTTGSLEEMRQCVLHAQWSTKVISIQATAYVFVFISILSWPIIILAVKWPIAIYIFLTFFPLRGFFNMVIFMGHMIYSYHRAEPSVPYIKIMFRILWESSPDPVYVHRLSIVEQTLEARGNLQAADVEIEDESGVPGAEEPTESENRPSMDGDDEENNSMQRKHNCDDSSSSYSSDDCHDDSSSYHPPIPTEMKVVNHRKIVTSLRLDGNQDRGIDSIADAHAHTDADHVDAEDSIMGSTFSSSMIHRRGLLVSEETVSSDEMDQLSMKVQRKGEAYGPNPRNSKYISSSSLPMTISPANTTRSAAKGANFKQHENGNDAHSLNNSSLTKSFDESGSYKCVVSPGDGTNNDGDRSSMCDLSGFDLSEMGNMSFRS